MAVNYTMCEMNSVVVISLMFCYIIRVNLCSLITIFISYSANEHTRIMVSNFLYVVVYFNIAYQSTFILLIQKQL
jgi:hypothetical protein